MNLHLNAEVFSLKEWKRKKISNSSSPFFPVEKPKEEEKKIGKEKYLLVYSYKCG